MGEVVLAPEYPEAPIWFGDRKNTTRDQSHIWIPFED